MKDVFHFFQKIIWSLAFVVTAQEILKLEIQKPAKSAMK